MKPKIPQSTRRLTRLESARLGVLYSSRRYVDASLKRISDRTKTYSERQVRQAKLGHTLEKEALYNRDLNAIQGLTRRDREILKEVRDGRYNSLNDIDKREFFKIKKRYSRTEIDYALGSPETFKKAA